MPVARVLCIAPRWLGDTILARPAIALLGRSGFDVEIEVRGGLGRMLADLPGVTAIHAVEGGRVARFRAAGTLRRRRYDAVLILAPAFSSAVVGRLTGAPVRIGWATDHRRSLLTVDVPLQGREVHLATQYCALAEALLRRHEGSVGPEARADPPAMPLLARLPEEHAAADRLRSRLGIGERGIVVVAPGARYGPAKRYPPERFAAAAGAIAAKRELAIVLVGEAADAASTRAVRAALPHAFDLAGQTSLPELVGLLAGAAGVLANDSGTMHLAAALGRPVVGVFGSSNPEWTHPLGPRATVVAHPVPCAPCYASECRTDFACMLAVSPERLVEAWRGVAEAAPPATTRTPREVGG